jgi:hypothetical protein
VGNRRQGRTRGELVKAELISGAVLRNVIVDVSVV